MTLPSTPFSTAKMQALCSIEAQVRRMLVVEAALARAQVGAGLATADAAAAIDRVAARQPIDLDRLQHDAVAAGNLAIPFVKQLTAAVAAADADAARIVHRGATSQDILDTALVLQLRDAMQLLRTELQHLGEVLLPLVERHAATPMAGRTLLQQALPITFGFKVAGWLDAIDRHDDRLATAASGIAVLQFGGAAGTLANLGDQAEVVAKALATELGLALPAMPWHAHRDRIVEVATSCGALVGTLGKIARDIELAAQTEVGELAEPTAPGRGGSSTLPHKRNPVGCTYVVAAAMRTPGLVATMLGAMLQEHERAAGAWQAEWAVLPELLQLTAAALAHLNEVAGGLVVDAERMQANLGLTDGLLMAEAVTAALTERLGRLAAHERVQVACQRAVATGGALKAELAADAEITALLPGAELDRLLDPANYLGQSRAMALAVAGKFWARAETRAQLRSNLSSP